MSAAAGIGAAVAWTTGSRPAEDPARIAGLLDRPLPDADGSARRLSDWHGKVRLVNFWATWCPPCVEEMPLLQRMHERYQSRGAVVIGIGIDSLERIRTFRDEHRIGFPLLVGGAGGSEIGRGLGNDQGVLPYSVLLSGDGRVVRRKVGKVEGPEVQQWLDEVLQA